MGRFTAALKRLDLWLEQQDGNKPRPLQQDDFALFDIESHPKRRQSTRTVEELKATLRRKNPVRWRRMNNDFRWMQRQLKKMGYNPEDARWLL